MQRKNIYTVPDLQVKEIIQYFNEMEIQLKASDILKPTFQSTIKIYEIILELYCGNKTSDIFSKVEAIENGHLYEESLSYILLQKRMSHFLRRLGIDNFGFKDLSPDSKRLINILSTVINFSMYRDNKRGIYEKMCQMNDEKSSLKNEIETKIGMAQKELERSERESKKAAEDCSFIQKEISNLEVELKEFYKLQRVLMQETEQAKNKRVSLNDKLSSCQLLSLNLKQEITCLKTQIVSDPTKLMELLEEMRCLIVKEKESVKHLEYKKAGYKEKSDFLSEENEETKKAIKKSLEIKDLEKHIEEIKKFISDLEIQLKNYESSINALKIRINHVIRQISHLESKMYNLQDNDKRCSDEITAKLVKLKGCYDVVSNERSVIQKKIEENISLTKSIEHEIVKRRNNHMNDITEIQTRLMKLKDDIFNYFSSTKRIIESSNIIEH